MANELSLKEQFDLMIPKETVEFIKKFNEMEARMKIINEQIKADGKKFLEDNDLLDKGYEQDGIKIIMTKPYEKTVVDTQKMKDEGIYELYSNKKSYDGYIKVSVNYDD